MKLLSLERAPEVLLEAERKAIYETNKDMITE